MSKAFNFSLSFDRNPPHLECVLSVNSIKMQSGYLSVHCHLGLETHEVNEGFCDRL